jgi:alpha-ribazole phosphatase
LTRVLLARHGNTKGNSAERFWGNTDVELNADGINQAERLRDRLAGEKIDAIYSSDLCRAKATAEIVASRHGLKVTVCPELHEINFGQAEGLSFQEIGQRFPEVVKAWPTRDLNFGYPGGERIADLNDRVRRFPVRLDKHDNEDTVLVAAHAGVLRLLICHLMGIEPWHWRQMRTDIASLSILETHPLGAVLHLLNDVSHLE